MWYSLLHVDILIKLTATKNLIVKKMKLHEFEIYKYKNTAANSLVTSKFHINKKAHYTQFVQDVRRCEWTQPSSRDQGAYYKPAPH